MLEMLLTRDKTASGSGTVDPTKGPGPTTLIGYYNPRDGYETGLYGQVIGNGTDMINGIQLRELTGNLGAAYNDTILWLKYVLDGKIIYVPRNTVSNQMTWQQLYQQGLVYGTDDNGTYPSGVVKNQKTIISWGQYKFLIRLVSVGLTDPSSPGTIENTTEWARLMYPVANDIVAADCENGEKWAGYDLDIGATYVFSKESNPTTTSWVGVYRTTKTRSGGPKTTTGANRHWRPVLELIS